MFVFLFLLLFRLLSFLLFLILVLSLPFPLLLLFLLNRAFFDALTQRLNSLDNIYNWFINYFEGRGHAGRGGTSDEAMAFNRRIVGSTPFTYSCLCASA